MLLAAALACPTRAGAAGPDPTGFGNLTDPEVGVMRLEELMRLPVPSVRAAIARNPALTRGDIQELIHDPNPEVAAAALAAFKLIEPSWPQLYGAFRPPPAPADPSDAGELRAMIAKGNPVEAALVWRHLPAPLRRSLAGVGVWSPDQKLQPLLDFIAMAEAPGGPLAKALYDQLATGHPAELDQMKASGLLAGLSPFDLYAGAIAADDEGRVRSLAAAGLALEATDAGGRTPLMVAAGTGDLELIVALLEAGARADARDAAARSPSDYAAGNQKPGAAQLLARTAGERSRAAALAQLSPIPPADSRWAGRWVDVSGRAPYKHLYLGWDGSFDLPPVAAGAWTEVGSTQALVVTLPRPLGTDDPGKPYGKLQLMMPDHPGPIRLNYFGDDLQFWPAKKPAASPSVPPGPGVTLPAPRGLRAESVLDRITLTWEPSAGATGYLVYRNGRLLNPAPTAVPTLADENLPVAATAHYAVRAVDAVLHLSSLGPAITVSTIATDTDGRGLPDRWQRRYFGHLGVDPNADPDGDGLTNLQEYQQGTDPTDFYNNVEPIIEPLYHSTEGPQNQLAMLVKHPDGTPWANAPVPFIITSGRRGISLIRNTPPYVHRLDLRTDQDGLAQCFLQPLN